jgi:DNA-binding protein
MTEEKPPKRSARLSKAAKTEDSQSGESVIFIGKKSIMNYIITCLTFFNSGANRVVIKARGRAISRAVNTFKLLRRAFLKDLQLQSIAISTEEMTHAEGQKSSVLSIEISAVKT